MTQKAAESNSQDLHSQHIYHTLCRYYPYNIDYSIHFFTPSYSTLVVEEH
nr:MAG TPA: hypothetical protein [Caudoviricetes sp.]